MEIQVNNEVVQPVTLNEQDQAFVVKAILEAENKGKRARKEYEDGWNECEKAYNCQPDPLDEDMEWQTNIYLPWSRDAVDSALAHMIQVLLPKNNQVVDVSGRTQEDDAGAEVMQKYLEYLISQNTFIDQFTKALKQGLIYNHSCVKVYWRQDKRTSYEWLEEPVIEIQPDEFGQPMQVQTGVKKRKVSKENITYNGVWYDCIDLKDFVFYPIYGEMENTMRIHTTHKHLEDLVAQVEEGKAPYFNIDKVKEECKKDSGTLSGITTEQPEGKEKEERQGLKIKEAWIDRIKIGEKVHRNFIGTLVNDKVLIRFQPNGYEMGKSPFVWCAMNPDGNYLYGDGLLSPGIGLQKYGNFIANMRADELKVKLLPGYKYYDDTVFDPYNFINRPAGLVEVANAESAAGNLVPINPHIQHMQTSWTETAEIKIEFENVTVPKVVKGAIESKDTTATEINYAQSNSQGKMHVYNKRMDEGLLKPLMEMTYLLIYQRVQEGDQQLIEDVARVTQKATAMVPVGQDPETGEPIMEERQRDIQEMVDDLPKFLPLPEVDIKVIGYQNQMRKEEQLIGLERFNAQTAQDPEARTHLNIRGEMEMAVDLIGLDRDKILNPVEDVQKQQQEQQDAAKQQQDMVMQAEAMKLQLENQKLEAGNQKMQLDAQLGQQKLELEAQKMQMDAQIEMQKLALEEKKLELEMRRIEQADRHAEMNASMQQDQFNKTLASKDKEDKK